VVRELIIETIRTAENTAALEANTAALRDAAAEGYILETALARGIAIGEARAAERMAAARRRRRGAHANPSQEGLFPRLVPGIALAGAALKPLSAAVRHSWPAQHLAQAGAIAGTVATLATAAVVVPHAALTSPFGAGTSAAPAPAASIYSATPVITPSSLPVISAFTHPKANPDAAASRPLTLPPPPAVPPAQGPGGQQGGNQPSQDAPVVAGTLQVTGGTTDLSLGADGLTYSGSATFTAEGGSVRWSTVSNSPHVAVSTDQGVLQGVLQPGDSVTLTVSVDAAAQTLGGTATVHVYPGISVGVTWLALPPLPDPAGSVLPTALPSVLPSL
jgi:hypothetical protein